MKMTGMNKQENKRWRGGDENNGRWIGRERGGGENETNKWEMDGEGEKRIESIDPTTSSTTHSKQRHIQTPTKHTHSPRTQQLNNKHKRETREEKESEWTTSGTKKHVRCIATHVFEQLWGWTSTIHCIRFTHRTNNRREDGRWNPRHTGWMTNTHEKTNIHTHQTPSPKTDPQCMTCAYYTKVKKNRIEAHCSKS